MTMLATVEPSTVTLAPLPMSHGGRDDVASLGPTAAPASEWCWLAWDPSQPTSDH